MRDLIACLSIWLGEPARRMLRAATQRITAYLASPSPPEPWQLLPPPPAYMRGPVPAHVRERQRPLNAEAIAMVRPYVVTHERQAEQHIPLDPLGTSTVSSPYVIRQVGAHA